MDNIRRGAEVTHQFKGGPAKESESLVVVAISVNRGSAEKRVIFYQKCGRPRGITVIDIAVSRLTAPIHCKVFNCDVIQLEAVYLFVKRQYQEGIDTVFVQRFRKCTGHVTQSARFGEWNGFG